MLKPILTILTPTYNRCRLLPNLYESLKKQTKKNFEWLIIDDGSTDNTEEYIKTIREKEFSVKFYHKKNGGKHTALNFAHPYIHGEIVCIVDSDDMLVSDAVEIILNDWDNYKDLGDIGVFNYQRGRLDGSIISQTVNEPEFYLADDIHFRVNQGIKGDRCEVIRTKVLRNFPFPEFENERFMSEGWLWNNVAMSYKTLYRRKVIYQCEYLEGGLTNIGRRLRMNSPLGMMENCKSFFAPSINTKVKVKEMLLYCVYALCSKNNLLDDMKNSGRPWKLLLVLPIGSLLYLYWKWKYLR